MRDHAGPCGTIPAACQTMWPLTQLRTTDCTQCHMDLGLDAYTLLHHMDSSYFILCLPIMQYGSKLWSLTKTELNILECIHCKILRTIQGLPIRYPITACQSLIGSRSISYFISQMQLAFANSITCKLVITLSKYNHKPQCKGNQCHLKKLCLPFIHLFKIPHSKESWNRLIKCLLDIQAYITMQHQCKRNYPQLCPPYQNTSPTLDCPPPGYLCNLRKQLPNPSLSRVQWARSRFQLLPMQNTFLHWKWLESTTAWNGEVHWTLSVAYH